MNSSEVEARLQKRVAKNLLGKMQINGMEFFVYVHDLAKDGIGLTCNRELQIHDQIKISLNVPGHKTMELEGTVAWMRVMPKISRNRYHIGVHLTLKTTDYEEYVVSLLRKDYERRKFERFKDILEVQNGDVLDLLDAATQDVSAGGLYIRTGRPLTIGQQLEIMLSGKNLERSLFCLGEVMSVFETDMDDLDHPYGAGIKIISFVGEDEKLFSEYLKGIEEIYKFHWPETTS